MEFEKFPGVRLRRSADVRQPGCLVMQFMEKKTAYSNTSVNVEGSVDDDSPDEGIGWEDRRRGLLRK